MTNLVPGFTWQPIDVTGRPKRVKGRGAVGHVAVSGSANLVPSGTVATRSADWHWYNPKVGPGIQYIDLDLQCWASGAGNKTLAAFESQGGLGTAAQVNAEPWNDNQLENAARFYAHLNETEGAPLQVMPNSLPGSRGLAGHRHGIDPWRVTGGELWSSSRGKLCPGDAKMAQLPVIVSRANEIVHGSPTPSEDDMTPDQAAALNEMRGELQNVAPAVGRIEAMLRGGDKDHDNVWLLWAALYGENPAGNNNVILKALAEAQTPTVDPAALAAALLADPANVDKLGAAIAAHLKLTSS